MSVLTGSLIDICDYIYNLIDADRTQLGIEGLYYGDQDRLPVTPAVCIEPDEKPRELKGAQRMTRVRFRVYVLIYYGIVGSPQDNRRSADTLAEGVETLIHSKPKLDGLVIHGMCTTIESGYVMRDRSVLRASRILYEAESQQLLPGTD